jgi:PP-loop superfamily ATP-utilizing enzyme
MMRLEFADDEIGHAVQSEVRTQLLSRAGELGVPLLTIDLEGFKSGKLNRVAG